MSLKSGNIKKFFPYFLFVVAIIVAYKVITENIFANGISQLWNIITPFFYGFLLAFIINIPFSSLYRLLDKIKLKFIRKIIKPFCLIISYLFFVLFLLLAIYLIIPYISKIGSHFISNLPAYYERILQAINYMNNLDFFDLYINPDIIMSTLQTIIQNFNVENLSSSMNKLFSGFASSVFNGILAFISSIYILIEKNKFKEFIKRLLMAFLPDGFSNVITEYTGKINKNFRKYIFVQTIDGIILGSIVTIQLFIMRSPYFLILGLILGIVNYIPYFGSIIGTIFAVFIVAFTQGLGMGAIAALVLLITQQIDGNVIQPKLMGGSFTLSPFLVIVSITIGGAAAGVFGMIAAIPIVAVLKDILEIIISHYERKKMNREAIINNEKDI